MKFQLPLKPLAKFEGNVNNEEQTGILFNAVDYLELVDYTGRIVKKGKRGAINQLTPPILKRLNLNTDEWLARSCAFEEKRLNNPPPSQNHPWINNPNFCSR